MLAHDEVGQVTCMRAAGSFAAVLPPFRSEVSAGALEGRRVTDTALVDVQAVLSSRHAGDAHADRHPILSLHESRNADLATDAVDEHRFRARDDRAKGWVLGRRGGSTGAACQKEHCTADEWLHVLSPRCMACRCFECAFNACKHHFR